MSEVQGKRVRWGELAKLIPLVATIGSVFILTVEPDHTRDLPALSAFGTWLTHFLLGAALFLGSLAIGQRYIRTSAPPFILAFLLLPLLLAPFSLLLDIGFGNPDDDGMVTATLGRVLLSEVAAVTPFSFMIALSVSLVVLHASRTDAHPGRQNTQIETFEPKVEANRPRLRELLPTLPAGLGEDLVRIEAKDHYVEVTTTHGRALISDRFSECVFRLSGCRGMQCHRSHWINTDHVKLLKRNGSAYICVLSNADEVPISRRRWTALKDAVNELGEVRSDAAGDVTPRH